MAAQVFGSAVHYNIGAQFQGLLHHRRGKGIVDTQQGAVAVRELSDCFYIGNFKRRIGGRFEPYQAGTGGKGLRHLFEVCGIDIVHLDAEFFIDFGKKPVSAAIDIVDGQDLVAGFQQFQYGIDRCKTAGKSEAGGTAFQLCQYAFERSPGWVAAAGVIVTFVDTGSLLYEGCGLIDGNTDGSG